MVVTRAMRRSIALLGFAVVLACGGIKRPSTNDLVLTGAVYSSDENGQRSDALSGADVRATVDRNKDGAISSDEEFTTTTGDDGTYKLQFKVALEDKVVVRFSTPDTLPHFETLKAGPKAELALNAVLINAESLSCSAGVCESDDATLAVGKLGNGMSGGGRVFNPVDNERNFPGRFGDADGNLLVSGVFSAVQLTDSSGNDVQTLSAPADLKMKIPRDTWKLVVDITPGDDRIQIPLYAFNETSGEWVREGQGHIEDDLGNIVPEAKLSAIRSGTFQSEIFGAGQVSHFSFWNVDWPITTKTCISGVIVADDGEPAEGASILMSGVTYTGSTYPVTVGADGKFCDEVMRSEEPNEDVDQNNQQGDTQKVAVRAIYAGKLYALGKFDTPKTAAQCGGACLDIGEVKMTEENELVPKKCTVKGTVTDPKGNPVDGALVIAFDADVPDEARKDVCGVISQNCSLAPPITGADGRFENHTVVLEKISLIGVKIPENPGTGGSSFSVRSGSKEGAAEGCPTDDITLVLDQGHDEYTVTPNLSGQQILWSPSEKAHRITVQAVNGTVKWEIESAEQGFSSPVTYGQVPAGATQVVPANNQAPAQLITGDDITVEMNGIAETGYSYAGTGKKTVP